MNSAIFISWYSQSLPTENIESLYEISKKYIEIYKIIENLDGDYENHPEVINVRNEIETIIKNELPEKYQEKILRGTEIYLFNYIENTQEYLENNANSFLLHVVDIIEERKNIHEEREGERYD